ncbi:MAG: HD domain-containing protein [Candidatus Babeliaceae bacterium]|nr:HD domain-containing protein [Candidatus Babeliaceae bacterium]
MRSYSKKIFKKILLSLLLTFHIFCQALVEKLLYTTVRITDPCIIALVRSQAFQRLGKVAQYGIDPKVLPNHSHSQNYNRAKHSLGVYYLLQRYKAPFTEQVAGLLHDASHTAFSHVGDKVFKHTDGTDSYQDLHHLKFISRTEIPKILEKYGLTLEKIDHKNPEFTCLEGPLPDLCADRIEYNLSAGVLEKLITEPEAVEILNNLRFENDRWFFTNTFQAKKFAMISLWNTEHVWGSQMSNYVSHELADAIRMAFELNILSHDEFIHGTDEVVWQKLCKSNSTEIHTHLKKILDAHKHEAEINRQSRNNKFRGVNPLVLIGNKFTRLTESDKKFAQEYEKVKKNSAICYLC